MIEPPRDTGMSRFPNNALFPRCAGYRPGQEDEASSSNKRLDSSEQPELGGDRRLKITFPREENPRGFGRERCDGEMPK